MRKSREWGSEEREATSVFGFNLTSVQLQILISRLDLALHLPFIPALAQLEERQTVIGHGII